MTETQISVTQHPRAWGRVREVSVLEKLGGGEGEINRTKRITIAIIGSQSND